MNLIEDFYSRLISLNFNMYYFFFLNNKFILLFIFLTYILIIFDNRFKLRNKLLIFIFFFLFITALNMYDYKDLHIFIRELYWYSLVLNGSFIFHVCWLHWIYVYLWNKRNNSEYLSKSNIEFLCNVIKNLGFVLSLSFLVFLLNYLHAFYKNFLNNKKKINKKKYILILLHIPLIFILVIIGILRFFIYIFISYSKFLIGKESNIFNFWNITMFMFYFIFSWFMAYYIFGISRLLFNWLFIFSIKSIEIFMTYKKEFIKKYPEISHRKIKLLEYFFINDFEFMINEYIFKYQVDYFNQWYKLFYLLNYNHPQYIYLFFNQDHLSIANSNLNDGINYFKFKLSHIFVNNDSWFSLAKAICIQRLDNKKGNMSNEEIRESLNQMREWFNLTREESNDIALDCTIVKTGMDIYGYEKIANYKKKIN